MNPLCENAYLSRHSRDNRLLLLDQPVTQFPGSSAHVIQHFDAIILLVIILTSFYIIGAILDGIVNLYCHLVCCGLDRLALTQSRSHPPVKGSQVTMCVVLTKGGNLQSL